MYFYFYIFWSCLAPDVLRFSIIQRENSPWKAIMFKIEYKSRNNVTLSLYPLLFPEASNLKHGYSQELVFSSERQKQHCTASFTHIVCPCEMIPSCNVSLLSPKETPSPSVVILQDHGGILLCHGIWANLLVITYKALQGLGLYYFNTFQGWPSLQKIVAP